MARFISDSTVKARKDHHCEASSLLLDSCIIHEKTLSFAEYRVVAKAKSNGYKIKKGDIYYKQTNEFDGRICDFKAIPEMLAICEKYEMLEDW
jgi:hypothetical protein